MITRLKNLLQNHTPAADTEMLVAGSTRRLWSAHESSGVSTAARCEKSLVLDAALLEFRELRARGTAVNLDDFCARYPDYRKSVRRLLDVESSLGDLDTIEDPFPEVGGEFVQCDILDTIGAGAMARVYLAADNTRGGRLVVLKVALQGRAEAASLGKLDHPNIVRIEDVREDPETGLFALVMPYQGNATLTDLIDMAFPKDSHRHQPPRQAHVILDVAQRLADVGAAGVSPSQTPPSRRLTHGTYVEGVVDVAERICAALEYAHGRRVWHRDLKPSNILLSPAGRPMLLDFNLAVDGDQESIPLGGTLPYMAPEQIKLSRDWGWSGKDAEDPRADIFSLGVILFELLAGQLPFPGVSASVGPRAAVEHQLYVLQQPLPSLRALNPDVPDCLEEIVVRCLARDPAARYQTVAEVSAALAALHRPRVRAEQFVRRHRGWIGGLAATLLLALAASGSYWAALPPWEEQRIAEAQDSFDETDYEMVVELLTPLPEMVASDHRAPLLRGSAYLGLQKTRLAIPDLEAANAIRPTVAGLYNLSICYGLFGRRGEAKQLIEQALELDPGSAPLLFHYAQHCGLPTEESLRIYDLGLEIDPGNAHARLSRASIECQFGDYEAAAADIENALLWDEYSSPALQRSTLLYYNLPKTPELLQRIGELLAMLVHRELPPDVAEEAMRDWESDPWSSHQVRNAVDRIPERLASFTSFMPTPCPPFSNGSDFRPRTASVKVLTASRRN